MRNQPVGATPTTKPAVIHVADFDLDIASIRSETGMPPALPAFPNPFGDRSLALPGSPKDPQKLGRDLVDAMGAALVKELNKAGIAARRLAHTNDLPNSGWLVRGLFTEVDQGDRLQRSVIGLGQGKTEVQVRVELNDLSQGKPRPFQVLGTCADGGKSPGSAPMVMRFPAAMAARFVLAGKDLDRNVRQTADRIAEELARRAREI